jgi:hypothetical protein
MVLCLADDYHPNVSTVTASDGHGMLFVELLHVMHH